MIDQNEIAIDHLFNNVKASIGTTYNRDGLNFSALVDIYKGERVFVPFKGATGIYHLPVERAKELHKNVFGILLQYFDNHSFEQEGIVKFKLVHGVNFIVAQPECILTPDGEGGNLETGTMKARWDILANTELKLYEPKRPNFI